MYFFAEGKTRQQGHYIADPQTKAVCEIFNLSHRIPQAGSSTEYA